MRQIVYKCDKCKNELGNNAHISLYIGSPSGIAIPPTEERKRWIVKDQIANKAIHFCSTEHIKAYFDEKMGSAMSYGRPKSDLVTIEEAREILGKENVHGFKDFQEALAIKLVWQGEYPIPFTREYLLKAKEQDEILIFCLDSIDGEPLTMGLLNELVQERYDEKDLGKFLYDTSWYKTEDFYCKDTMEFGWKLISKELVPNSKNKTYPEQDEIIKKYPGYKRATALEVMYLTAVHKITTGKRLFEDEYTWTSSVASGGRLVSVGGANRDAVDVGWNSHGFSGSYLGVCLSR